MKEKILGVLGGVGPLATIYFAQMIVEMTDAKNDQEHISMVILNHATIPDRTNYILDNSKPNPLPVMISDAIKLEKMSADFIVIPCNTAHYFFDRIQENVSVPIVNILEVTIDSAIARIPNLNKVGILATQGTIISGAYQKVCKDKNLSFSLPSQQDQKDLTDIIYNQVKAGKKADYDLFMKIVDDLKNEDCQAIILGCTELSVIKKNFRINQDYIIDSVEALAQKSIELCGKTIKST